MKRLDLIIEFIEYVQMRDPSVADLIERHEALAAARELKDAVEKINKENNDRKDAAWCIAYDLYGG